MALEQRLIDEQIERGDMITVCCVTGEVKLPTGEWIGYRFKQPYNNISHGLSPIGYMCSVCECVTTQEELIQDLKYYGVI